MFFAGSKRRAKSKDKNRCHFGSRRCCTKGDLSPNADIRGTDALGQLGCKLEEFLNGLRDSMNSIADNSQTLAAAAEEMTAVSSQMQSNAQDTSTLASMVSKSSTQVQENVGLSRTA